MIIHHLSLLAVLLSSVPLTSSSSFSSPGLRVLFFSTSSTPPPASSTDSTSSASRGVGSVPHSLGSSPVSRHPSSSSDASDPSLPDAVEKLQQKAQEDKLYEQQHPKATVEQKMGKLKQLWHDYGYVGQ